MFKKNFVLVFLIIAILVSFGLGFWFGLLQVVCPVCPPEEVDFSLFWEAYHKLQEKFVDREKFDIQRFQKFFNLI